MKKRGAMVLTIGQVEGDEAVHENWKEGDDINMNDSADPPRIWDKTLTKPGCAFSRSVGDQVAEYVGVVATPEILVKSLDPKDRYLVIESDGVSEFLTNEKVLGIISKAPDLLAGAKAVVDESYSQWLKHDERTDDITIILCKVRVIQDSMTISNPVDETIS